MARTAKTKDEIVETQNTEEVITISKKELDDMNNRTARLEAMLEELMLKNANTSSQQVAQPAHQHRKQHGCAGQKQSPACGRQDKLGDGQALGIGNAPITGEQVADVVAELFIQRISEMVCFQNTHLFFSGHRTGILADKGADRRAGQQPRNEKVDNDYDSQNNQVVHKPLFHC